MEEKDLAASRGWKTIDSAPRDGTEMLLWSPMWDDSWGIVMGRYTDGVWVTSEGECSDNEVSPYAEISAEEASYLIQEDFDSMMGPTHWFALPSPPRDSEAKQ